MGNTRFNLGEVQPGEIQHIIYELRRCSVVIADLSASTLATTRIVSRSEPLHSSTRASSLVPRTTP